MKAVSFSSDLSFACMVDSLIARMSTLLFSTIMFGDPVGFTAWSSVREASQVFSLLETVYHSFDTIAKRRRAFKVETVGDCCECSFCQSSFSCHSLYFVPRH